MNLPGGCLLERKRCVCVGEGCWAVGGCNTISVEWRKEAVLKEL